MLLLKQIYAKSTVSRLFNFSKCKYG